MLLSNVRDISNTLTIFSISKGEPAYCTTRDNRRIVFHFSTLLFYQLDIFELLSDSVSKRLFVQMFSRGNDLDLHGNERAGDRLFKNGFALRQARIGHFTFYILYQAFEWK